MPILREIGLKGAEDIEPEDLKESAEVIAIHSGHLTHDINNNEKLAAKYLPQKVPLDVLADKSAAIVAFLHSFEHKLQQQCGQEGLKLSQALLNTNWVLVSTDKPAFYPKSLSWYGSQACAMPSNSESFLENHFEKPCNMISRKNFNLAGSIKPVAYLEFSAELESHLGWDVALPIDTIIKHLKNIVLSYSAYEKVVYSELTKSIYTELSKRDVEEVKEAIKKEKLPDNWIWNSEVFILFIMNK